MPAGAPSFAAYVNLALEHDGHFVGGVAFVEERGPAGLDDAFDAVSGQPLEFAVLHAVQGRDALERVDDLADRRRTSALATISRVQRGAVLAVVIDLLYLLMVTDAGCAESPSRNR